MESFLDLVIDELLKNHAEDFSDYCVVFPTRRAGLIFRKKLAAKLTKSVWSPELMSIEDFINELSPVPVSEDIELLFELFSVYKTYYPEITFEKYFHWGEMMLNDFNEIDIQLADAEMLFKNITEIKRIETEFGLAEEDAEHIASFWKNFSDQELSRLKTAFKNTWENLPKIYLSFKKRLHEKRMCYEGMAYRNVLENLKNGMTELKWNKIIFAGFYSLNRAHEQIINELTKKNKAILFWDADVYYTDDATQEAGNYFRKKKLLNEKFLWKKNYFESNGKEIIMAGVPLHAGQAKYLGDEIGEQISSGKFEENKTAIVLPDENLLFPVLYSLPSALRSFNVTMGYPLKKSLLNGLIQSLFSLHKFIRENKNGNIYFYSPCVINLSEHPYIHRLNEPELQNKIREIKKYNKIYCSIKELSESTGTDLLFRKLNSAVDVFTYVTEVLKSCAEDPSSKKDPLNKFDKEILLFAIHEINALYEIINPYSTEVNAETAWQFIRKVIDKLKIPFSGEPVQGLQIMGFLETRVLDFENLYILSVNEDILPASSRGNSFIPYSLRKGFGLPAYEDQDAVYAYHFYRLLQRAKNIHLIYNTEVKSLTGGEKSRFLLQISYEMKQKFGDKIKLHHSLISTDIHTEEIKPISIEKNKEVMEILKNRFEKNGSDEKNGISASALSAYINCSLQFYFRYIAGIKEKNEIEENIEADVFGKILHGAMQLLYGKVEQVSAEKIKELLPQVENAVSESFIKEFPGAATELEGKNYLARQVIIQLVRNILDADKEIAPFAIEELEKTYLQDFNYDISKKEVWLKGVFDRVDNTNGLVRIVDYKTGKDELHSKKGFEEIFTNPKLKATFQLYFYAYIYKQLHPETKLQAGIYRMKSIRNGIDYLDNGEEISEIKLQEFENVLKKLVGEIMDNTIPFSQTEDEERCIYCPYREICNR
ncbi:MAG TPA: PD-(D/E)XK nuclease family protein [Bacteroidia bacterium]|nr:PD-(D/E)XK nuclease family protein [Bacteroidia bacterium]